MSSASPKPRLPDDGRQDEVEVVVVRLGPTQLGGQRTEGVRLDDVVDLLAR